MLTQPRRTCMYVCRMHICLDAHTHTQGPEDDTCGGGAAPTGLEELTDSFAFAGAGVALVGPGMPLLTNAGFFSLPDEVSACAPLATI